MVSKASLRTRLRMTMVEAIKEVTGYLKMGCFGPVSGSETRPKRLIKGSILKCLQ